MYRCRMQIGGSVQVECASLFMTLTFPLVTGIQIDDLPSQYAFCGDNVILTITGIEMNNVGIG